MLYALHSLIVTIISLIYIIQAVTSNIRFIDSVWEQAARSKRTNRNKYI